MVNRTCAPRRSAAPSEGAPHRRRAAGFTLIELLVVMAIIGLLVGVALPTFKDARRKAQEATLRENLFIMRQTIDQYFADKGYYPASLDSLVDEQYLRSIPVDPITNDSDWQTLEADTEATLDPGKPPGIFDVKSRASGTTLDGKDYGEL